ncbi:MAG: LPXTG cell wall anchor domain-containing protein [Oscillospiraceae bacterium]|nr:LPXTG cell wall anchor domain-containing protein [Oscillospiraceae bacterium]
MKRFFLRTAAFLTAHMLLLTVFTASLPVFADGGEVRYNGQNSDSLSLADFLEARVSGLDAPDFFGDGAKGMVPGQTLRVTVKLTNRSAATTEFYLLAAARDENGYKPGQGGAVFEGGYASGFAKAMEEFFPQTADVSLLDKVQIEMKDQQATLYSVTLGGGAFPYTEPYSGALLLSPIASGQSREIDVTVTIPKELGNEYAGTMATVDWVFLARQGDEFAFIPPNIPKTGISSGTPLPFMLGAGALILMFFLVAFRRRKKEDGESENPRPSLAGQRDHTA